MNSVSRSCTVRVPNDSLGDHATAFRTALTLFGTAELADFLPAREHPQYLQILGELVSLELAQGWKAGKPIAVESYKEQYPELFTDMAFLYKMGLEEYDLIPIRPDNDLSLERDSRISMPKESRDKTRPVPAASQGRALSKQLSEPEIALQLHEVMMAIPQVGAEFQGFRLIAELGKGAFGKVFLAQQGQLAGRHVALKIASDLFLESQTLAQLQHTHIVPIHSFHPGQPFQAVCMPYLGSTTLAHVLDDIRRHKCLPGSGKGLLSTLNDRKKKSTEHFEGSAHPSDSSLAESHVRLIAPAILPPASAEAPAARSPLLELEGLSYVDAILWLGVRLADGLAHAHERDVLHRDLKPANILLTDEGLPMLVDFNLAQNARLRNSAAAASVGGTLPYMAPEHLEAFRGEGLPIDARSDVYSLGVILFELLTGVAPFPTYRKLPMKEIVQRMIQDRQKANLHLRVLNKNIPPAIESLIRHCLHPDPARRYQSARELQEDLQRHLDHRPLRYAPNPSWWERARKFQRRHPRFVATSVAAVALAVLVSLSTLFVIRDQERASLEARAKLTRFHDDAQTAYFLLHAHSAKKQLAEGERVCLATLGHFQVLDDPHWLESSPVRRLPEKERQLLQEEAGQLLVLLAYAQQLAGEGETQDERRQEIFKTGLQYCSLAESCFPKEQTPQTLWKQRGDLHKGLLEREKAQACFEKAKLAELKTAHDLYLTARLLAEKRKFTEALPIIRQAMRLKPQDYNLHFLEGVCHDSLARHTDAIASYHTCITLRPTFFAGYYNRGLSYLRHNQCKAAHEDFAEVIRLRPDFVEAYVQRGLAYQGLRKYAEAEADLTAAINRGYEETRIYFLRAQLRERAGDLVGAKKDFAEGLRREPGDELSWNARGVAYVSSNAKQALHDFEQALKLNPRSLPALQNKAHVLAKHCKRIEEAVQTLDKALEYYPDNATLRAGRGVYLARLGKRADALKDAEQALLLDTAAPNLYHVAGIYALTSAQAPDDRQEALRLLSAALKKGYGFEYLEIDRDLDPLRTSLAFRRVIDAARALQMPLPALKK